MKFIISQKEFNRGINIVQRAVSSKNTMPILTGIFLEAVPEKGLHLMATDLELGIEYWVKATIKEEGAVVLPANHLANIVRELPDEDIDFAVDQDHYQANLKCLTSEFTIKGYDSAEFPQLPVVNIPKKMEFSTELFKEMIEEVQFSTSTDQSQPALTGALMAIDEEGITMVSTNTYRLAYSKRLIKTGVQEEVKAILPGNTLNELSHLLDEEQQLEIMINSNYVSFNFNDIIIVSRLIEGQFPNYKQVMPKEFNTKITVERALLQKAVKRASLIARLDSNVVSLKFDNQKMVINSVGSDSGSAHEEVEIEMNGPEQTINIDASYLLDVLKVLKDDNLNLELIGPLNPLAVRKAVQKDEYVYLIMPVRPGT